MRHDAPSSLTDPGLKGHVAGVWAPCSLRPSAGGSHRWATASTSCTPPGAWRGGRTTANPTFCPRLPDRGSLASPHGGQHRALAHLPTATATPGLGPSRSTSLIVSWSRQCERDLLTQAHWTPHIWSSRHPRAAPSVSKQKFISGNISPNRLTGAPPLSQTIRCRPHRCAVSRHVAHCTMKLDSQVQAT